MKKKPKFLKISAKKRKELRVGADDDISELTPYYVLVHPKAMGGVVYKKKKYKNVYMKQKQDRRARPATLYAEVFFPKFSGIGAAHVAAYALQETVANRPQTSLLQYVDRIFHGTMKNGKKGKDKTDLQVWQEYKSAGHRIRKLKIMDLGDATDEAEIALFGRKIREKKA